MSDHGSMALTGPTFDCISDLGDCISDLGLLVRRGTLWIALISRENLLILTK
jgi:hypothetical protein